MRSSSPESRCVQGPRPRPNYARRQLSLFFSLSHPSLPLTSATSATDIRLYCVATRGRHNNRQSFSFLFPFRIGPFPPICRSHRIVQPTQSPLRRPPSHPTVPYVPPDIPFSAAKRFRGYRACLHITKNHTMAGLPTLRGGIASSSALIGLAAALLPMAMAHDHDTTKIEEGEAVSADPIVSWTRSDEERGDGEERQDQERADRFGRIRHYGPISSSRCSPLASCSPSGWF